MRMDGKQLTFSRELPVKYSARLLAETEDELTIEAEDEESYLKIFTPFRGVAKLYVFENDHWVDAETSMPFSGLDLASLGLENFAGLDEELGEDESSSSKIIT